MGQPVLALETGDVLREEGGGEVRGGVLRTALGRTCQVERILGLGRTTAES